MIDELRVAIPEEIRAAKRINSEGERIIEKAQEEAETIVARAQEQAAFLIEERGLTQAAEDEGRRILDRANAEAEGIRRGADEYAASVLVRLEAEVDRTLHSIRKGIALIDSRAPLEVDDGPRGASRRLRRRRGLRARAEPLDRAGDRRGGRPGRHLGHVSSIPAAALLAEPAGTRRDYAFERSAPRSRRGTLS